MNYLRIRDSRWSFVDQPKRMFFWFWKIWKIIGLVQVGDAEQPDACLANETQKGLKMGWKIKKVEILVLERIPKLDRWPSAMARCFLFELLPVRKSVAWSGEE